MTNEELDKLRIEYKDLNYDYALKIIELIRVVKKERALVDKAVGVMEKMASLIKDGELVEPEKTHYVQLLYDEFNQTLTEIKEDGDGK